MIGKIILVMFYKMPVCALLVYYSIMVHSTFHLNTAENGRIDGVPKHYFQLKKIHSGEKRKLMFCCIYRQYNHQKKTWFLYNYKWIHFGRMSYMHIEFDKFTTQTCQYTNNSRKYLFGRKTRLHPCWPIVNSSLRKGLTNDGKQM